MFVSDTKAKVDIDNIQERGPYDFRVFSQNSVGQSSEASEIFAKQLYFKPKVPNKVHKGKISNETLTIEWEVPEKDGGAHITEYIVYWRVISRRLQ